MSTGRLEAFSDGVLAILITIMVLELKIPHGASVHALRPLVPLHLLFWLSLVPVSMGWMGESGFGKLPTIAYGLVLLLAAVAYNLLQRSITAEQGQGSRLRRAIGRDWKGRVSPAIYVAGIALAFVDRWIALGCYIAVALLWLVPDRRVERVMAVQAPEA